MSMNFSAHSTPRTVALALALLLGSGVSSQAATAVSKPYYQTVAIDKVLSTRPALVVVSPLYQVTVQVVGAEITGISMELSKQKNFSVSRAENGKMIFLDSVVRAGGADLNLILDDETVLPIRLQVTNAPSGTRVYKFMTGDALAAQMAAAQAAEEEENEPATAPTPPPAPAPQPAAPPAGNRVAPAPAVAARTTTTKAAPAPVPVVRPVPAPAAVRPAAAPAVRPAAAPAVRRPATPAPVVRPAATPPAPAATRPAAATPASAARPVTTPTLDLSARRDGADALVAYKLTSPTGGTLFANTRTLKVTDGRNSLTTIPVELPRSSMAPILGLIRVKNAPKELTVSLDAQTLGPARIFTLSRKVTVQ